MRSLVEEHAHALVGELVAKAVLVGVVHPFGHPQKGLGPGQAGGVPVGCKERVKTTPHTWSHGLRIQSTSYRWACSPGSRRALSQPSQQQLRGSSRPRTLKREADWGENADRWGCGAVREPMQENKGVLRSELLATVPLKEREIDFLDSSSAGVCSRGGQLVG